MLVITVIQLSMWSQEEGEERNMPERGGQMKTSRRWGRARIHPVPLLSFVAKAPLCLWKAVYKSVLADMMHT